MRIVYLALAAVVLLSLLLRVKAQQSSAGETAPLILTAQIPLPGVHGRFDHFAFDPIEPGRVFISAQGNNSVEVINLVEGTEVHRITGIPQPQGIAYAPGLNKIFVGSRKGTLYVYDGASYKLIASIVYNADVTISGTTRLLSVCTSALGTRTRQRSGWLTQQPNNQ
jgi:hypothetical protein